MCPNPELHEMCKRRQEDDTDSLKDLAAAMAIMFFIIGTGAYLFGLFQ